MNIRLSLYNLMFLLIIPGQDLIAQSCYQKRLGSAIKSYESGNYGDAIKQFEIAKKVCTDAKAKELDEWIAKAKAKQKKPAIKKQPQDSDGDGVADVNDDCPYEWGLKNNSGCPEEKKEVITLIKIDTVLFKNLWSGGYIYNDSVGIIKPSVRNKPDNIKNASWVLSTYRKGQNKFYTIKNVATGHYLVYDGCEYHPDKDVVFLYKGDGSNIADEFYQSNMTELILESKKVWKIFGKCGAYLHVEHRTPRVECGSIQEGWHSAAWQIINIADYNIYDREDETCPKYSNKYVSTLRGSKTINIGSLTILYDYIGCSTINLFHADAPDRLQKAIPICDNNGYVNTAKLDDGKYILGGDWGIQIVFGNGVKSCIRDIQAIGTFTNGSFFVKATDIYNEK